MNITSAFFNRKKASAAVVVDANSAVEGVYRRQEDGSFFKADLPGTGQQRENCWLALPPGSCAVRSLQLEKTSVRDMEQALVCLAQSSLLSVYEDGYAATCCAQQGEQTTGTLFWCEKKFLENCVAHVEAAGFNVCGFLVPEMLTGSKESCLLIYENRDTDGDLCLLCHASPQSAPMVLSCRAQTPGRDVLYTAMMQEIARQAAPAPERILFWQPPGSSGAGAGSIDQSDSPPGPFSRDRSVSCQNVHGWVEILPLLLSKTIVPANAERPFCQCLDREKQQPLELRDYFRLTAVLAVTLMIVGAFIFTLYSQLEHEVAVLEKEAARVTRASQKAAKATQMIRNLQEKNSTIRKFAQDKPYSLGVLKIIAEATARESRLDNVTISRDGSIVITGECKAAEHAMALVEKLEESPRIIECKLTALDHGKDHDAVREDDTKPFKFTVQAHSQAWAAFFREGDS